MCKVALITGATRGIGKQIALTHAKEGYHIALNYRKENEELESVKKEIEETYKDRIVKIPVSYDLWEMNEGVHLYSVSAIYGALNSMIKIYEELQDSYQNNRLKRDDMLNKTMKYKELKREIRAYKSEQWKEQFKEEEFEKATRAEAVRMKEDLMAGSGTN